MKMKVRALSWKTETETYRMKEERRERKREGRRERPDTRCHNVAGKRKEKTAEEVSLFPSASAKRAWRSGPRSEGAS